ncbi:MAG: hypothetical protein ABWX67_08655 [Allosphingosinicella sp.]
MEETKTRIGLTMSVRIDGEAVMAPRLHEPLSVGAMMLTGPERKELERIPAAALRPC